ncbi:MAG: pilus assembly protein PilY [Gammaproteobacteria bacterium HGW-Gammaproteobacteria-13]|nr:MAG: pilus assembly protein PilY [Gammaproteobacteria bacterium HGW-Gammaproteobacteria-13]
MNTKKTRKPLLIALSSIATSSLLVAALDVQAAVSQSPLSLTVGVPPNLILTLDDSGSMRWAFVPDSANGIGATRRAKSPDFNPMYYDPKATYKIPPRFNTDGTPSATPFTTSFTLAYNNGFDTSRGSYNLSNGYRVSWSYDPASAMPDTTAYGYSNTTNRFAQNPTPDYNFSTSFNWTGTGTSTPYTVNNIVFTVTRTTTGSGCTVNITSPNVFTSATCSRSTNTYTISTNNATQAGVAAYYYLFDVSLPNCTTTVANQPTDDNCYRRVGVSSTSGIVRANDASAGTDERQNFAIWYSFYRNRALATVSAASIAFGELPASTRLTWQGLTTCAAPNTSSSCNSGDNLFREYSQAQRGRLFNWMQKLGFPGGTPLRAALNRAGNFLTTDTAWQKFPNATGNNAANTYACRPSYHILMTDGVWNGDNGTPATTLRADHSNFNLPDGTNYNGSRAPYADATTNTLADLAMHYWSTDLKTNLDNRLKPFITDKSGTEPQNYWNPRNNPASWQHMVNFTVGLGLTASLKQAGLEWDSTLGTFGGTGYTNLVNGSKAWPAAAVDSANNVYDLWHTAINSRGEFFSADSPESVVQAFTDIMSRIADRRSVAAKPAVNSGQLVEDVVDGTRVITVSYQTSYASDDNWSGDLKRSEKERVYNPVTDAYEDKFTEKWSAKGNLPADSARNITIKGNTTNGLQPFIWANAGNTGTVGTLANLLNRDPENGNVIDSKGEARLNYLRGVRTGEGTTFRTRTSVLGDLYSSSPAVVSGPRYLVGFANRLEDNTAYSTFANTVNPSQTSSGRSPRVYVGGNDGMLHGFNAKTGVEEFAFVPTAVFAKLNKLTGKNYSHEFYVDGSPTVADAYDGTQWRTILVGTLRAGGKGLFALDITTPGSEKLLWEFDDSSIPAANTVKMGHSFAQPTIARLHTGKWAVVFGNGYESTNHTNGKAALFIVDAFNGALLKSLEVSGTVSVANGLSTPKLADYNGDGVADYAYAGDIQGNLWRFNLLRDGRDPSTPFTTSDDGTSAIDAFKVSYGAKPLFTTTSSSPVKPQPITSAPSLVLHPSGTGYIIVFGTGKYYEDTDKDGDKSIAQSVYGIWDTKTRGESTTEISITRSSLVTQTINSQITGVDAVGATTPARTISSNDVQWLDSNGNVAKNGWVLDLKVGSTLDGEMIVENMAILGRTILFQSLIPNDDPCADGAGNWTYAINPFTGGKTAHHSFDFKDVTEPNNPKVISAIKQDGEGGLTVSQKPDSSFEVCTGQTCLDVYPDPSSIGRQTWRPVEEQ